jgi:hypothetical protein
MILFRQSNGLGGGTGTMVGSWLSGGSDVMFRALMAGGVFGFIWAIIACSRRRQMFLSAGIPPRSQAAWFCVSMLSMGCYVSFLSMLAFLAVDGRLPREEFLFLLLVSLGAFGAALSFANFSIPNMTKDAVSAPRAPAEPRRGRWRAPWRPSLVANTRRTIESFPATPGKGEPASRA